jgi:hypothetical protein
MNWKGSERKHSLILNEELFRHLCEGLYKHNRMTDYIGYWRESQKERDHWEDQDVGGWTILKWILERYDGMVGTGWNWLRIGTSGGLL